MKSLVLMAGMCLGAISLADAGDSRVTRDSVHHIPRAMRASQEVLCGMRDADGAVTNVISCVTMVLSATNTPAAKLQRTQCEAITKSGTRCKRNAIPGGKLCRQHQKIADAKTGKR